MKKISNCRCAVLGLGGVGSASAEALVRLGVGAVFVADNSPVKESNLNRQLIATSASLGKMKTLACKERFLSINPLCSITCFEEMLTPQNIDAVFAFCPDFIVDAIDNVTAKLALAVMAKEKGTPLYMSMGTGGRLNPTMLRQGDIKDTVGTSCSLSRVLRRELKKRGVDSLSVVYSLEAPSKAVVEEENGRHPPSSSPFVPPAAGYALASMAIENFLK